MTKNDRIRTDQLLSKLDLRHANVNMYFSEIKFFKDGPKTFQDLLDLVVKCWEKLTTQHRDWKGNVEIVSLGITFGHADAMIAWQAKDQGWAKIFRSEMLGCIGHRTVSVECIANEGGHKG